MQDESKVRQLFQEQADHYSAEAAGARSAQVVAFLKQWFPSNREALKGRLPLNICEFGGAGGLLLDEIHRIVGDDGVLHNAELVESYRERQVNKRIVFVNASILNSGFEDGRFDIIALRHVIHHLVGNDLAQTRRNQEAAIRELFRILRPGGLLLIEEQVNNSELACRLVFFLSNLASKLKLRVPFFEVTPNTIVGFLTSRRLEAVCRAHAGSPQAAWLANEYERWRMGWKWKLTLLMSNTGTHFLAIQKP